MGSMGMRPPVCHAMHTGAAIWRLTGLSHSRVEGLPSPAHNGQGPEAGGGPCTVPCCLCPCAHSTAVVRSDTKQPLYPSGAQLVTLPSDCNPAWSSWRRQTSSLSFISCRRSEWPRMTHGRPMSARMSALQGKQRGL